MGEFKQMEDDILNHLCSNVRFIDGMFQIINIDVAQSQTKDDNLFRCDIYFRRDIVNSEKNQIFSAMLTFFGESYVSDYLSISREIHNFQFDKSKYIAIKRDKKIESCLM